MKHQRAISLLSVIGVCLLAAQEPAPRLAAVRFAAIDVFVDSGTRALAAWQIEFSATTGNVKIVSIEGGEHPAFKEPPYYDPKAIQRERAVMAAFNTASASQLPTGWTRVATVHVQVSGDAAPRYSIKTQTAAGDDGRPITVQTTVKERNVQ